MFFINSNTIIGRVLRDEFQQSLRELCLQINEDKVRGEISRWERQKSHVYKTFGEFVYRGVRLLPLEAPYKRCSSVQTYGVVHFLGCAYQCSDAAVTSRLRAELRGKERTDRRSGESIRYDSTKSCSLELTIPSFSTIV